MYEWRVNEGPGTYTRVREGPAAIHAWRYYKDSITHTLQLDLVTPVEIDFASIKPARAVGKGGEKWFGGAEKVRAYLATDADELRIFKELAYTILDKRAGPERARDALVKFLRGLP